jgi:hypothetical protein
MITIARHSLKGLFFTASEISRAIPTRYKAPFGSNNTDELICHPDWSEWLQAAAVGCGGKLIISSTASRLGTSSRISPYANLVRSVFFG